MEVTLIRLSATLPSKSPSAIRAYRVRLGTGTAGTVKGPMKSGAPDTVMVATTLFVAVLITDTVPS